MIAVTVSEPISGVAASRSTRVASIDVFRGVTMAVMVFVNALGDVHGLPWWTYHARARENLMTYVDMVFPFFLFIVGMSLPLSVEHRLRRNPSLAALWLHVAERAIALLALGLILANAGHANAVLFGINGNAWALLGIGFAALYLNAYPKSPWFARNARFFRWLGFFGVAVVFALFRRLTRSGHIVWMDKSYPEILGLIGFTYAVVAALYISTRRWRWAPAAWFLLLLAFCCCSVAALVPFPGQLPWYFFPLDNGSMACIAMAGVVVSQIFLGTNGRRTSPRTATLAAIGCALGAFLAGRLLIPLGISKIRATPTWCLWSIAAAIFAFTLLYWICDRWGKTAWAWLVRPAGANPLLTYLLPDIWFFSITALGVRFMGLHLEAGSSGVVFTVAFTAAILLLARLLTRAQIRLQL